MDRALEQQLNHELPAHIIERLLRGWLVDSSKRLLSQVNTLLCQQIPILVSVCPPGEFLRTSPRRIRYDRSIANLRPRRLWISVHVTKFELFVNLGSCPVRSCIRKKSNRCHFTSAWITSATCAVSICEANRNKKRCDTTAMHFSTHQGRPPSFQVVF